MKAHKKITSSIKPMANGYAFSFKNLKEKLFEKTSPQTLAIFRIILGLGLIYEANRIKTLIPFYYINPEFFIKWEFFKNIPIFSSSTLYGFTYILFFCSILILFGFFFRIAVFFYLSIYTYFLLIEASYYNNHYYFIALLLLIIFFTGADNYGSIKYLYQKYRYKKEAEPVPVWNYFLLRFQVFLVYFVAGFVKLNFDWISTNTYRCIMDYGTEYPKNNIFYHSNFGIYFFTFGGLLFDLIIPLLLIQKRWRMYAIPAILTFHAINAATLNIGVFPYLMAGATLIFFRNDIIDYWKQLFSFKKTKISFFSKINSIPKPSKEKGIFSKKIFYTILIYISIQIFLPYRHLLIPGNVGWTGEANNFSWRMKMGLKAPTIFELFVHNKFTGEEYKPKININPHQYSSLWICPTRIKQIADYVAKKTQNEFNISTDSLTITCKAIVIYNNHPPTPIFDSTANLLEVKVNKFGHSTFITKQPYPIPKTQYYWLNK